MLDYLAMKKFIILSIAFIMKLSLAANKLELNISKDMQLAINSEIEQTDYYLIKNDKAERWVICVLPLLKDKIKNQEQAAKIGKLIYYEATRAGLDPNLVLAIITVESNFNQYAISNQGARGLMQIMPFWVKITKTPNANLFYPPINLRIGCSIFRSYLITENGNLTNALKLYNSGSTHNDSNYTDRVKAYYYQYQTSYAL